MLRSTDDVWSLAIATFRSLRGFNYRIWAIGAFVSNVGTWMQRTAQDWLVLTALSGQRASAVGLVMALQFGPQLLLHPLTGWTADRFDRRKLLCATQAAMAALALGLGLLTLSEQVTLHHVYAFALLHGCVAAFDAPARQTFVSDLVPEGELSNAVALNSTSFNAARLLGPASAGLLIGAVGTGWVFVINGLSFLAVLSSLGAMRVELLQPRPAAAPARGSLSEGLSYVWHHRELRLIFTMLFLICTFGLNFPIFISTMSARVFQLNAETYGVLVSLMAIGSVAGALLSARRARPKQALLPLAAAAFGFGLLAAAAAPSALWFGGLLIAVGAATQTFSTTANASVQLATEPARRGRVMALYLAVALGCTLLGAPVAGWVADQMGPRWALVLGAVAAFLAAAIGALALRSPRPAVP